MRHLILGTTFLALTSAGALAQAPQGPVPTAAVAQRTEPGRYWVFFDWGRADLPPDGRKVVEEAAQSFLRTGSARSRWSAAPTGPARRLQPEAVGAACRHGARRAGAAGRAGGAIAVRAEGENAPIVANAEGVREPLNRYVAIDFPEREAR